MILDVGQCPRVAVLTRQAAILIRGVRPSYGWLAGATPPAADVFDEARLLGWRVGCRMLAHRLAETDSSDDALLRHLADWVDFELQVDATRWTHIRPVAMLGASVFEDLVDRDDVEPELLDAWVTTLEWCLGRCATGEMEVETGDRWLLDTWRDRAEEVRGGDDVAALLRSVSLHAGTPRSDRSPEPLLRSADVSLMQTLFDIGPA